MFDFPEPFRPVIQLKELSHPEMTVRVAYDLKPSMMSSSTFIVNVVGEMEGLSLMMGGCFVYNAYKVGVIYNG